MSSDAPPPLEARYHGSRGIDALAAKKEAAVAKQAVVKHGFCIVHQELRVEIDDPRVEVEEGELRRIGPVIG